MKLLLDTCTFLWLLADSTELSKTARDAFTDPANDIYLSVVSEWEMITKNALGKLPFPEAAATFIPRQREAHGIESLPLREEAVMQLSRLPDYHRDPFDRMLICQSIADGLTLLTPDQAIIHYPVRTLW